MSSSWGWLGSWSSPSNTNDVADTTQKESPTPASAASEYIWGTISSVSSSLKGFVEQEKIILEEENKKHASKPVQIPSTEAATPWEGCSVSPAKADLLKQRILALCRNKRNFLDPPPPDANFAFDYDSALPTILACLKADANLHKMRFWAVPEQISEKEFWRNYFYRVAMIKEAYGVGQKQLPTTPTKPPISSLQSFDRAGTPDQSKDDFDDFVSDASAAQGTEVSFDTSLEEEIEAELKETIK